MLSLLTLIIAQAAAPVAPDEAVAQEIVVIGDKLKDWKGGVYKKDGRLTCRTETSSGDFAVDTIRCAAMVKCYAPRVEELDRIANEDSPRAERNAKMQVIAEEVVPCIEAAEEEGTRLLATARAAE